MLEAFDELRRRCAAAGMKLDETGAPGGGAAEDRQPLLPFDPEAPLLEHDVALARFLARKVLVASSRPLRA